MRTLTIKRRKSIVGCAMKVKIYISSTTTCELAISNTPCVFLGSIKNGKEETFEISEEKCTIFAIIDQYSKDYCNDSIELPAGQEAISLSGKNKFNLAKGNPFIFDKQEE